MNLPTIDVPTFEINLPVLGRSIVCRPFLVKEQKILLMARESEDSRNIINATKQILSNCIKTQINIDDLSITDVTFIFLQLRANSVGETVKVQLPCTNESCNNKKVVEINLKEIELSHQSEKNKKIYLTDTIGMVLKYPSLKSQQKIEEAKTDTEKELAVIKSCVDIIFDGDVIYKVSEVEDKEFSKFIEGLSLENYKKILEYFEDMPRLQKKVTNICEKCQKSNNFTITEFEDFFA